MQLSATSNFCCCQLRHPKTTTQSCTLKMLVLQHRIIALSTAHYTSSSKLGQSGSTSVRVSVYFAPFK
jgi:hypothetical protein